MDFGSKLLRSAPLRIPDNVNFHLGLLRCLRSLGHFGKASFLLLWKMLIYLSDTLHTHGVLTRHPEWETILADFQVESAWIVGSWYDVQTSSMVLARLLLAMRSGEVDSISESMPITPAVLAASNTAAGVKGYRRSYESVLNPHLNYELELIHQVTRTLPIGSQANRKQERRLLSISELSHTLSARLNATLPTFRNRELVFGMRRTDFALL